MSETRPDLHAVNLRSARPADPDLFRPCPSRNLQKAAPPQWIRDPTLLHLP